MSKMPLEEFIKDLSVADIKEMIYTLAKQIFPVLDPPEKEEFIKKLMGKFTDDRISSMANL
jgi:hypothetical protein